MASVPPDSDAARHPPELSARVPVRETLAIDSLVLDAGTQVRVAINQKVVDEYAQEVEGGAAFPPVVVFRGERGDLLSDGFHRVHAYRKAGRSRIEADVRPGSFEDALWFALGANSRHGERMQPGDKRRAIELAYGAWPDASQHRIAEHVGCSQQYVCKIRGSLTTSCQLPGRVLGSDGRTQPATRSGSDSSSSAPEPEPDFPTDSDAGVADDSPEPGRSVAPQTVSTGRAVSSGSDAAPSRRSTPSDPVSGSEPSPVGADPEPPAASSSADGSTPLAAVSVPTP